MTLVAERPSAKHEAWRYSDHAAVAELWPHTPREPLTVRTGERFEQHVIVDATSDIHEHAITLERNAFARLYFVCFAGRYGRVALDVTLHAGARFELGAVLIGGGDATVELVTSVNHAEPNASSMQTVRAVAAGRATASYLGKVAVARGAQKTDAGQSFRALLLDRTATANAKPELEIFADDVKCAHGAAVGELDRQALFYLASRGVPPAEARTLLLQAFIAEVFEDAEAKDELNARALAALEALA